MSGSICARSSVTLWGTYGDSDYKYLGTYHDVADDMSRVITVTLVDPNVVDKAPGLRVL